MKKEIVFYRMVNNKCPVEKFLDSLPAKAAQKAVWTLRLLVDLESVPAVYFSKMSDTNNIWECRIAQGSNIYRIFAFLDGNKIVLTNGIVKKTQKTPRKEIEKAEMYKRGYLSRFRKN